MMIRGLVMIALVPVALVMVAPALKHTLGGRP
jgi:hypothetical protein